MYTQLLGKSEGEIPVTFGDVTGIIPFGQDGFIEIHVFDWIMHQDYKRYLERKRHYIPYKCITMVTIERERFGGYMLKIHGVEGLIFVDARPPDFRHRKAMLTVRDLFVNNLTT
jgi:hypothetical protein